MKKSSSICYFILPLLVLFHVVNGDTPLSLSDQCKKIINPNGAPNPNPKISLEFCIATLEQDPKSQSADLYGLGFISMNFVLSNTTEIISRIKNLLADPSISGSAAGVALDDCLGDYTEAIESLNLAHRSFDTRNYYYAYTSMQEVAGVPGNCETAFARKKKDSLLTLENQAFDRLASIPFAITFILKDL